MLFIFINICLIPLTLWSLVNCPPTQSKAPNATSFSDPVTSGQGYSELLRDFSGLFAQKYRAEAKTIGTTTMKTNSQNEEEKMLNCHSNRTAEKSGWWSGGIRG